jgi:hypothetical protein
MRRQQQREQLTATQPERQKMSPEQFAPLQQGLAVQEPEYQAIHQQHQPMKEQQLPKGQEQRLNPKPPQHSGPAMSLQQQSRR